MPGIPQDTRSPFQQLRLIEIYNGGGSTIPAFGAVEVTGVTTPESGSELTPSAGRVVMTVGRPSCDSSPRIMFNLMNELPVGKYGVGTSEFPCWALSDTTDAGDRVGSVDNSYELGKGKSGFMVAGGSFGGATRIIRPNAEFGIYLGTLQENMCSADTEADVGNVERIGPCCDAEELTGTITAKNPLALAGCTGSKVVIIRYCDGSTETFMILNVQHIAQTVMVSAPYYDVCALKFPKKELAVMHCCPANTTDTISMHEHTYVADVKIAKTGATTGTGSGTQTCELQLQNSVGRFCAFEVFDPDALTDVYSPIVFSPLLIQVDTVDDGTCLQKVQQYVYVLCWDDEFTPEDVLCLEECEAGTA